MFWRQITMPSGTRVIAWYQCYYRGECRLDLTVYPLVEDIGHSEGLCGNCNGDWSDDRMPKGSSEVDNKREPVRFVSSYM